MCSLSHVLCGQEARQCFPELERNRRSYLICTWSGDGSSPFKLHLRRITGFSQGCVEAKCVGIAQNPFSRQQPTSPVNIVVDAQIFVAALAAVVIFALGIWAIRERKPRPSEPLPTNWAITGRPVFTAAERRVYRLLREALPHHVVLSKLPLVRFCQPIDPAAVRYWYELLGAHHVTFAVCSANGRVLAAIDLESDRATSRRALHIKQSVLDVCRIRYLRCPQTHLPSINELQLLVPQSSNTQERAPQSTAAHRDDLHEARDHLATTVAHRRAERSALWQDSTLFQDSFFAPDSRLDFLPSEFAAQEIGIRPTDSLNSRALEKPGSKGTPDGGVVVD
jgi:hypothetical protein